MSPAAFMDLIIGPGLWEMQDMGGPRATDAAAVFLLAVALHESGPGLRARYQGSPAIHPGPARGWWQFETVAVVDLFTRTQSTLMLRLCERYSVAPNPPAIHRAIEGHDLLAVGVARALILTHPDPLPGGMREAWEQYATLWRPGVPRVEAFRTAWATAQIAPRTVEERGL